MDGMIATKVFSFMDSTEFCSVDVRVVATVPNFQKKLTCVCRPLYFHWKMNMRCEVAKTSKKECRIEDVIGMYGESGLSCSVSKPRKTLDLIIEMRSSGNGGVYVHRVMVETTIVTSW